MRLAWDAQSRVDKRDGTYQRERSADPYHTYRWTRLSKAFRAEHPLCAECQRQGIGRQLFHAIQSLLPHSHAWLCTCPQVSPMYDFYIHEGFRPYRTEAAKHGYTWVYMEKPPTPPTL